MIKEIKYNGHTSSPSDYECDGGDMAAMCGLIHEEGDIRPLMPFKTVASSFGNCLYIHKPSGISNRYICKSGRVLSSKTISDGVVSSTDIFTSSTDIQGVNAIGNTLVVHTDSGNFYLLFKDNAYINLGNHLPECPISFGLQGTFECSEIYTLPYILSADEFNDEVKATVTEAVLSKVNKFIADKSVNVGRFFFPFLVRYAYRLYDGFTTMCSAPVLMVPSSHIAPYVLYVPSGSNSYIRLYGVPSSLDFRVIAGANGLQTINNWSDIIKSIDIFISKPIYTYDQNGECERKQDISASLPFSICKLTNTRSGLFQKYQQQSFADMSFKAMNPGYRLGGVNTSQQIEIPRRSTEQISDEIKNCSSFYFLHSINIENLTESRTVIPVEEDYLQSLVTRETLVESDFDSHDTVLSKSSFTYNSRINLFGVSKRIFSGFRPAASVCYTDGFVSLNQDCQEVTTHNTMDDCQIYYFVKDNNRTIIVNGGTDLVGHDSPFLYLYYPNTNCYQAVVKIVREGTPYCMTVKMEPHKFLNGSVAAHWFSTSESYSNNVPSLGTANQNITVTLPNKIYSSNVNNPFLFPASGINTIGGGEVLALATAAKAMSPSQFGQYPLYVFTSDGVWAMSINGDGGFGSVQPITQDVCISENGITQLDTSVVFATKRGIMLLSGSSSMCISDVLDSDEIFNLSSSPFQQFAAFARIPSQMEFVPLKDYLNGSSIMYDYKNQRIIVYNALKQYAYMYYLTGKSWSIIPNSISSDVYSYPDALAINSSGDLINVSEEQDGTNYVTGSFITRPIKLEKDILTTIDSVIQRGNFAGDNQSFVKQVLYGSRDLTNWSLVWSSDGYRMNGLRGTPYKYFRLAVYSKLKKGEYISGCTIQYSPKLTNRIK